MILLYISIGVKRANIAQTRETTGYDDDCSCPVLKTSYQPKNMRHGQDDSEIVFGGFNLFD